MAFRRIHFTRSTMATTTRAGRMLALAFLTAASMGCSASSGDEGASSKFAPLEISGVRPGVIMDEVVSQLGNPLKRRESDGFIVSSFDYPELTVAFDESRTVALIESRSSSACFLTKVCPGAKTKEIVDEIRTTGYSYQHQGERLILNGDGCWGEVHLSGGVAESVSIPCSP